MISRKFFRRTLSMLFVAAIMLFASVTHAEIYTGEGSYVMSEGENLGVAKERAKADVMRNASEQAGVYVRNYSRMRNFNLEEDIIETMTANILKLVENPHFYPLETVDNLEGVLIRVTVKVQIDDSDINRWLNKDDSEKSILVSQMESLRKSNEEQARQIAELKRQLAQSTTKEEKERITNEFANVDKIFLSNQKVDEGWKLYEKKDFNGAKNLFDEAVQLNSDNANAWYGRGTAYDDLGQYERAIKDLDKAIQLNPNYAMAYNNRGFVYMERQKKCERAIQDFDMAIQLNPNYAMAYNNRGYAYTNLRQYERAIQDFNNAIQINSNYYKAYNGRGNVYGELGKNKQAIKDYDKAIQINPNYAMAYNNRGISYYWLKQYENAIADANKAIQLNPKYASSYQLRGAAYKKLGNEVKAQSDFAKAKELGYKR